MSKSAVTASMSVKEREMIKNWADRQGKTMSAWAREVLLAAVPPEVRAHCLGEKVIAAEAPEQIAFREPDRIEAEIEGTPAPLAPERPIRSNDPTQPLQGIRKAKKVRTHPCNWLREFYRPGFNGLSCQGTCSNPRSGFKPCHWASAKAPSCPYFEAQFIKDGRPL